MSILHALRYPHYRWYFLGQALSSLGNMVQEVAIAWLAYRLTDSALWLGVVAFARQGASFAAGPLAGVLADRYRKGRVLAAYHAVLATTSLLLAALTATGQLTVVHLLALQAVLGTAKGLEIPARQSLVHDLIDDKKYLPQAIALNSVVFNTSRIVGPALAGLLIPLIGEALCFGVYTVVSYLIAAIFLLLNRRVRETPGVGQGNFRRQFVEGVRYAVDDPPIRLVLVLVAAVTLLGISFNTLLPVFAREVLGAGARGFGYLTSAVGVGSILGALYLGSRRRTHGLEQVLFAATLIFAAGVGGFALTGALVPALLALMVTGVGRVLIFACSNTLLQTLAADDKRGRVLSLYITTFTGALMVGSLLMGFFAGQIGAPLTVGVGGVGCVVVGLLFGRRRGVFVVAARRREVAAAGQLV